MSARSPRRFYSNPSSSSDGPFAASAPLDELQSKYRTMEVNRKAYAEDNQNTIRMQRQQIDKLRKDNERLKEDLALETRQARQANQMGASAQIAKLQDQGELYTRKIDQEKRRIEELDKQIKKMQTGILVHRKEVGGVNANRENNQQTAKQIRILENRLDKALVKFNEALAHNKQLRESIDNLRRERVVFDGIYRKLERELMEKKQKMAEIIEVTDSAYEARDTAQGEMIGLKSQADREQANFEYEWAQLGQLIEKDRKLKDFQKNKERERTLLLGRKYGDPALEEEQKLRKKVTKGAWAIAKDKANIHLSMEKVQSYEEAFAKIQKATKITDIDELVQTFVNAEDQNFSLFNYVNDLANEIEKVEEQIAAVHNEIHKYHGNQQDNKASTTNNKAATLSVNAGASSDVDSSSSDSERKRLLSDLDERIRSDAYTAQLFEAKYQHANKTVNSLKTGIETIFDRLGCQVSEHSAVLGNAGVTESNMMQYLGIIEARTNRMLELFNMHRQQEDEERTSGMTEEADGQQSAPGSRPSMEAASPLASPPAASARAYRGASDDDDDEEENDNDNETASYGGAQAITIQAPSAGNISDEDNEGDDHDEAPLTNEQLRGQQ